MVGVKVAMSTSSHTERKWWQSGKTRLARVYMKEERVPEVWQEAFVVPSIRGRVK